MAKYGSTWLSRVDQISESDAFDEDHITKQLHADLNQHVGAYSEKHSKRGKRKSRDAEENVRIGMDAPRKKRKKEGTEPARKGAELLSGALSQIVKMCRDDFDLKPEIHFRSLKPDQDLVEIPVPQTAQQKDGSAIDMQSLTQGKAKRGRSDFRNTPHDFKPLAAPSRFSLGSNRNALLQSILKDCSPNRNKQLKALESGGTALNTESDIPTPGIATGAQDKTKQQLERKPPRVGSLRYSKLNARDIPSTAFNAQVPLKTQTRPKGYMIPMLPTGYKAVAKSSGKKYHCPVEGCDKRYTRKTTLGEHMNIIHTTQHLRDNYDGTFTVMSKKEHEAATSKDKERLTNKDVKPPILPKSRPQSRHKDDSISTKLKALVDREFSEAFSDGHRSDASRTTGRQKDALALTTDIVTPMEPITTSIESSEDELEETYHQHHSSARSASEANPTIVNRAANTADMSVNHAGTAELSKPATSDSALNSTLAQTRCASILEDWELMTGVIQGNSGEFNDGKRATEEVAFSSALINSLPDGVEILDINFRVHHLVSGMTESWAPRALHRCICSVAAGKVMVEVGDAEFAIGVNGMWRIKPMERCKITNLHHPEAVIHVSTLREKI